MSDTPDPYGSDIAFTADGNLVVQANGALGMVDGPDTCVQAVRMRFQTSRGELDLHPDYGSDLQGHIGDKLDRDQLRSQATIELRRLVDGDRRFLGATDINASPAGDPGTRGGDTGTIISCKMQLAAGDVLNVTDLTTPDLSVSVSPSDTPIDDADVLPDLQEAEFVGNDPGELVELADAAAFADTIQPAIGSDT